jgi:hypothetical protein
MNEFAAATGVTGDRPPRRYLWTDAFAVCNFLALGDREHAEALVRQVHHILGRHRPDDARTGWISGLSEDEGERHPTRGGLRIGKPLNERGLHEPSHPQLEWEQDGQYFHYLTKWMHALSRMSRESGDTRYWRWAAELGDAAQRAFSFESWPGGPRQLAWKMSIDLSRRLVPSTGQHDAVDGLVTLLELQATAPDGDGVDLGPAISDLSAMCESARWTTQDALGIGGLLDDSIRLAELVFQHGVDRRELLHRILVATAQSLAAFDDSSLTRPAGRRLAFRELGLAIGLNGLERLQTLLQRDRELDELAEFLGNFRDWGGQIRAFWSDESHRNNAMWNDHRDINAVMLATSLVPDGFLSL